MSKPAQPKPAKPKPAKAKRTRTKDVEVTIEVCQGVEGPSIYVNGYRLAGPKPWGGGPITLRLTCSLDDILSAIPQLVIKA